MMKNTQNVVEMSNSFYGSIYSKTWTPFFHFFGMAKQSDPGAGSS
ncbi:MAG: hypothetical protein ACXWM6_11205 [Thermodesulfobacteriota bacterium]